MLWSFLHVGEKGAVVSKQQLSNEFLNGFRACEETPMVEHIAVRWETDVDTVWQVLRSQNTMLKKMEDNVGARTYPCLTPLEIGKLPNGDPMCFT